MTDVVIFSRFRSSFTQQDQVTQKFIDTNNLLTQSTNGNLLIQFLNSLPNELADRDHTRH